MLTDIKCKSAKPKDKSYKLSDSGGLFLLIRPNGSKYWQMKYRYYGISKKTGEEKQLEKLLSFGTYPLVSLAEAREKRDEAKKLLNDGIDPSRAKKEAERTRTCICKPPLGAVFVYKRSLFITFKSLI